MALARKKQDEKNLKTLRELVSLPCNKYCFDCNQRGPTYVNVTIGSFVCTKCSGMLRGLTPPHRVKSISMATFTTDEIELLKNKGNEYCKRVWLGLYDGTPQNDPRCEEQTIRDFMIDKYERKRYYIDPQNITTTTTTATNGHVAQKVVVENNKSAILNQPKRGVDVQNNSNNNKLVDFVADFSSADIFSAVSNNNGVSNESNGGGNGTQQQQQTSFANFDNNPVFSNSTNNNDKSSFFDLNFTNSDFFGNQLPLFAKCNQNYMTSQSNQKTAIANNSVIMGPPPAQPPLRTVVEDKYAALKDLDNALKAQTTLDWNSGSSGSLHSSPTPAGSIYSSSSPQSSIYGSPSQGQFASVFPTQPETNGHTISNPFNSPLFWNGNNANGQQQNLINPFQTVDPLKMNGFGFQNSNAVWTANPFKLGATSSGGNSSNPFL